MYSPGPEVEVEFAASLALGGGVGDDHVDQTFARSVNATDAADPVRPAAPWVRQPIRLKTKSNSVPAGLW